MDIVEKFYQPLLNVGPRIPALILSLAFGWLIIKLLCGVVRDAFKVARVPKALANIIVSLMSVVLWIILFSELAQEAGMTSLAIKISGSLFVVGLAIANGMSALAGDIVSGLYLAKDRDFEVGYHIKSGDFEGTVKKIDIRKIRLEDRHGRLFVIPNSKIDSAGWQVISRNENKG